MEQPVSFDVSSLFTSIDLKGPLDFLKIDIAIIGKNKAICTLNLWKAKGIYLQRPF